MASAKFALKREGWRSKGGSKNKGIPLRKGTLRVNGAMKLYTRMVADIGVLIKTLKKHQMAGLSLPDSARALIVSRNHLSIR